MIGQLGKVDTAAQLLLILGQDKHVDTTVQIEAIEILSEIGCTKEFALEGLLALTHNPQVNVNVQYAAYKSLKSLLSVES
jgi:hypothetical protein